MVIPKEIIDIVKAEIGNPIVKITREDLEEMRAELMDGIETFRHHERMLNEQEAYNDMLTRWIEENE